MKKFFKAMFHVAQFTLCAIFTLIILVSAASAEPSDAEVAESMATLLGRHFSPESVSVTVSGSRACATMEGAVLSDIRIDSMKLDALLGDRSAALSEDVEALASMIAFSRGEIVLLERDVNAYFDCNETHGFSGLAFDFADGRFSARGVFSFQLLITIDVHLRATGTLALKGDGVYLDDVTIYAQGFQQPDMLTDQVLESVNPLIEWSDIPFKVEFKSVEINDEAAIMTGYPETIDGATYTWTKKN